MSRPRWLPHPLASLAIGIAWLLMNNTVAVAHLLLASLLGVVIPWLTRAFWPEQLHLARPLTALKLLGTVLYDILVANLIVARLVLGRVASLRPAFIPIPLDLQHPYAISTLASIITLTPGTVSANLSEDRRTLLVHALDVGEEEALVAEIKQRYEAPLRTIFEC